MKRFLAVLAVAALAGVVSVPVASAGSLGTKGPPMQSCQEIEGAGGTAPGNGHAAESPGSPFNEPELNSELGGKGGQNYNEMSQYDVACYQVSSR